MSLPRNQQQLHHARSLRKNLTPEERHLWYDFLRDYPVKVYKQKIIGSYIVDFYCENARLIIELDGAQHYEPEGEDYDTQRSRYLESLGLQVVRFSNAEVNKNFAGVCTMIDALIRQRRKR